MNTLKELIQDAETRLKAIDTARLDAEILMCQVLDIDRTEIYAHADRPIPDNVRQRFDRLINKRVNLYPVAYLTGHREFWSREFIVDKHTLIPRPETEHLVETALELIPEDAQFNIADLGTGCGAIAITIASERTDCRIIATDMCPQALTVAKDNARNYDISNITFICGDWLTGLQQKFEIIMSNPPYIRQNDPYLENGEIQHEPQLALVAGNHSLACIRKIIRQATVSLTENGWLILEHSFDQGEQVRKIFESAGYNDVVTRQDYAGLDRISMGRWCDE